ncbi:Afadin- and alpha-actinin-binding protein [Merluccius polli]|uniref:Afadin- and alpha-actinin-binding protein n=1 Tax=Merluccius polli TaxID=89951 RepID=A0AA47P0E0_MERPO|nr:Afadin- and alpha-actinin-binding protein [Merluccius polli]
MSPLGHFSQSEEPTLSGIRSPSALASFCTEENIRECRSYVNQEVSSLGLRAVWTQSDGAVELNAVAVLNSMYDLIQLHRRGLRALDDMEVERLRSCSNEEFLRLSGTRLKAQLELSKRENTSLLERERRLQLKVKNLQSCLKNEKEEVQRLQNIIASRASQYNHDVKRKEREFGKLKERLNQLLVDKKEKKQAMEVLNYIGRADGKRSLWKTVRTEARHEGEMYRTLLSDYDARQRELVLENGEQRKVLQQMKRDMVSLLRSTKPARRGEKPDDAQTQADSEDEEEVFESSKEEVEGPCVDAREKLTNSIHLKWRKLKSHMERLGSQASLVQAGEGTQHEVIPLETHEQEMEQLKLEVQQCRGFIHSQQQLLQQRLSSPCEEEAASQPHSGHMLGERGRPGGRGRLGDEWKTLEEQRTHFEKERRNYTEAAIRLSHERMIFEEDRATWLKHQFLNLTPFTDQNKPQMTKSKSALSICKLEAASVFAPECLHGSPSPETSSSPRRQPLQTQSTADFSRSLQPSPENRYR